MLSYRLGTVNDLHWGLKSVFLGSQSNIWTRSTSNKYSCVLLEDVCVSPYYLVSGPEPVPDDKLTASSNWEDHAPSEARLHNLPDTDGMGVWSPADANINEYIQVRLLAKKRTTFATAIPGYTRPKKSVKIQ